MSAFNLAKRKEPSGRNVSPPPVKRRIQSTTTKDKVASFFKPLSEKPTETTTWNVVESSLLVAHHEPFPELIQERRQSKRRRIAAFDLDGTLVKTKSGNRFSRDAADWSWWDASVPGKLKQLDADGYQVIIFSNQKGISLKTDSKSIKQDKKSLSNFKTKINSVVDHLGFPISLYAATERDKYRKPRTSMWSEMLEYCDLDDAEGVDLESSCFVGDAGGRMGDERSVEADFASSDRDFATNIGIPYHTPEEYFLAAEVKGYKRAFDPVSLLASGVTGIPGMPFSRNNQQEIVLFVGSPGAGKSTFYQKQLAPLGYERINQDTLKTRDRCLAKATDFLKEGHSIAVDNTNPSPETRAHWVSLAKRHNITIRCVLFNAEQLLCQHNDSVRALNSAMNPEKRTMLPKLAFISFASQYQAPQLNEGFQDITFVDFVFQGSEEQRALWAQYYI